MRVAGCHVTDAGESKLLHQSVLQRGVRSLHVALAWLEFAKRIPMLSSESARPNCVMPWPPFVS